MPFSYDINPDDSSRIRRRSQRIESKENSERIEFKALGQNIGQLARGAVAFDPNAFDGDGDGLVQDNTPYERPAVLSNIANTLRQGLASTTGSNSVFTNGYSPLKGKTNREVAEYLVVDNPTDFLAMATEMFGSSPLPERGLERIKQLSFAPDDIEQIRQIVEQTLNERPALRAAWDRFGAPPIGFMPDDIADGASGVALGSGFIAINPNIKGELPSQSKYGQYLRALNIEGVKPNNIGSGSITDTVAHEWGHYLTSLTARLHPDKEIRDTAWLFHVPWSFNLVSGGIEEGVLERVPKLQSFFSFFGNVKERYKEGENIKGHPKPPDDIPYVDTVYSMTEPSEFIAEAVAAYFSPDPERRKRLNKAGAEIVASMLGIPPERSETARISFNATTGNSMKGLTPAEMAERIVPATLEEAVAQISDHQRMLALDGESPDANIDALKVVIPDGVDDLDFSPEAVKEMREVVTKALAENRMFREVAERHGFPPVLATKRGAKWVDGEETYAVSMIEGFPSIIVNRDVRNQTLLNGIAPNGVYEDEGMLEGTDRFLVSPTEDSMIAHEWGHYINRLAASIHPDEDVRALAAFWFSDTWDHDAGLTGPWKVLDKLGINVGEDKVSQRIIGARRFANKVKNSKSEKWTGYPHVLSQYGQSMPAETFAEGVSAILVGDESSRALVSPNLRDDIFDIIGKPESYQRDIAGGIDESRGGLASSSMPRDIFGGIIVPQSASDPDASKTPLGGRDWLKDATNEEIADSLAVRSIDDFVALTLMNMMYGKDPSSVGQYRQPLEDAIAQSFFPELRGDPGHFIDFSPQGIDRTREIIKSAVDASPTFAWILRTFGSVPIVCTDPDAVDQMRMTQLITGQQIGSEEISDPNIMGWSLSMLGIVLNTASKPGRKRHPIGQRQRASDYTYNEDQTLEEFLTNVDLSMEGTLYHEWFHSFYDRVLGWHKAIGGSGAGLPGERQDRQGYMYPGVADVDKLTELLKNAFDREGFIPYSSPHPRYAQPIIAKAKRKIARNGDTEGDFNAIMARHDAQLGSRGGLWTPEVSRRTLAEIQARYPYLLDDLAPLIRVNYGTANRQEQFAEGGTLFVTPDTRQRSNFLPPETESLYAYLLGLKPDPSVGDYQKPWQERSGLASRSSFNQSAISSLNERVHTGKELFVQPGEAHRRPDVVKQSGGMTDVSINGYKFSIMGGLPEFDEAYGAWNDWQENWRMRYISSEIMGLGSISSQADTRAWQSITNNHLKNGTINEASSTTKEEIQRSAMMSISMMKEIADSPYATDSPLYRSISNVSENDAIARLNVGETLSMPLTSFSPDYASVLGFSKTNDQTTISDAIGNRSNVIVKLREGTSVVYSPATKPTPDIDGREVNMPIEAITAGEFIVKSKTNVNGVDVVEIEQSRVIDPLRGSRATDGRKKVEVNKRRIKLNQDMTKSLQKIREKIQARENSDTDDERNRIDDDIAFESKRYGAITRALRTQNDDFDKLDTPRTVGGLASSSSLEDRANRHGVSLEAFNDEGYDADDIEWSTNDWSFGKTGQVRAGDVVVVRTRNDGKKEILTIERKSGPFRGALSLPGGLQNEGEDLYDTAEREMLEEVNVSPTDAMDRRILGQVNVKDWDPRFVEGGRIAGIRFDLSEEQSSVVKAGDDAGKFNWIDVEEMSTGKYPIAFGHASWLAEAFADDEVLGPRFAVLAEASRVRNQRLIKKIDEKRREKGIKEFGEMPDPSVPYTTTTDGIRTGLASTRSGIKDISTSREIVGNATRLMKDNANLFDENPIYDGYYGRTIDGAWVRGLVDGLKRNDKISHEDAVGMYLVLSAISDSKIYYTPETVEESFAIRMTLNNIRYKVSGNEEHTIRQDTVGTKRVWVAHRGSDYLGDFYTEEEALKVIQDSIADRTMVGPTRPAGLASSSNSAINWDSLYGDGLNGYMPDVREELEGYLSPDAIESLDAWVMDSIWPEEYFNEIRDEDNSEHYDVLQSRLLAAGFPEIVTIRRRGTPDSRGDIRNGSAFDEWSGGGDTGHHYGRDRKVYESKVPRKNIIGVGSVEEGEFFYINDDSVTTTLKTSPGLASSSSNPLSDIKSSYAESLEKDIADAGDYISRLESALNDWNETGVWRGADYDVVLTPGRPTKNMTRQEMLDIDYNPDNFAGAIQQRIGELNNELSNMRAARSRLDKQGDSTTPIEAILADPETLARIEKRAEEMRSMPRPDRADFFQDGEYVYVVHWGADVLDGGVLDPSRSRGDENSANVTGNTRRLNRITGMQLVAKRDDQKQKLADLKKIQEEFEKTGLINLSVAGNPSGVQQIIGYLISRGKSRNARYDGDKAYRPFPDADDLKELGIDELTPEMIESISENISNSVKGAEQRFKSLDAVADRLIADNYQYSSTYPAADLETANGYGGRYGDDAQEWGNSAPLATRAGIHVFRVRIGEDATTETGGPGEIHIVGQHAPIASLSIETHRNRGNQPTSAQFTWQGWLAEVVEADKANRRGLASAGLTREQEDAVVSVRSKVAGLASRGDAVNPVGKSAEEIAKEIELSPEEMKILEEIIPNAEKVERVNVNPAISDSADELLNSVRVTVGEDGIPFIYASPHPLLSKEIPDKRDWSAVIRPNKETQEKVKELINNLVKKAMGDDTPQLFWNRSTNGDKQQIIGAFQDETKKLKDDFTAWSRVLIDKVADEQEKPNPLAFRFTDSQGQLTWLGMWVEGLRDLQSDQVMSFFGLNDLSAHDVWGHLGTGRGFDRHGEWANMLAMFSLMDRWGEENGISREELVKLKTAWFQSFEFIRLDGEFKPPIDRQKNDWHINEWAIDSAFSFADTDDLEELISLIDDGNTHDTSKSKGLASTSGSELAEIAKIDIVRQSLKSNKTSSSGLASTQLTPTDDIEEAKRTGRPLAVLRPGTMPPKTQAAYDEILEIRREQIKEALELKARYEPIWSKNPTPPYSDEEKEAIQAQNRIRNELQFAWPDFEPFYSAFKEEFIELGFSEDEIRVMSRGIVMHLTDMMTFFSGQYNQVEFSDEARLQNSVETLDRADIAIAFPKELLAQLISSGRFKTQFETKSSRGVLHPDGRIEGDVAQLGYHPDTAPEMRPIYGYLTSGGVMDKEKFASIRQYGELQFVLKRDTHSRSTYTTQDSLGSGVMPSPMGVPSKDASGKVGQSMYAEAQIHGGLSLSDIDYVVVNVGEPDESNWQVNKVKEEEFESISGMLATVGIRVVPVRDGEILDTWNGGKVMAEPPMEVAQAQKPVKVVA